MNSQENDKEILGLGKKRSHFSDRGDMFHDREEDLYTQGEADIRRLMNDRDRRINSASTPEAKLRAAREEYAGTAGEAYLGDEMMEPQTLEEYVSNIGSHVLAWDDVDRGGHTVRGLKTELGTRRGVTADTRGINDFLARSGEGLGIDELAHQLWEGRPSQFAEYNDVDIKSALLNVLASSESASKTRNMVLENRLAAARDSAEAEEYQLLEQALESGAVQQEQRDIEASRKAVIAQIKQLIDSKMTTYMQKSDLNRLLARVEHAM